MDTQKTAMLLQRNTELEKELASKNRELEIEAALDRVRSRAMAMQTSEELKYLIAAVSDELAQLDFVLDRCFIIIVDAETKGMTWWMSHPETPKEPIGLFIKYHELPPFLAHVRAWEERQLQWQYILEGEVKRTWDNFLFSETELSLLPEFVIANMQAQTKVYLSASFNNFGGLLIATLEPLSHMQFDVLLRFAKVFDLTYTRFNDLKLAEALAREAQIQLALEKVRARTMAMQHSDELQEAADLMFQQLQVLGIPAWTCGYNIWEKDEKICTGWMNSKGLNQPSFKIPLTENPTFIRFYDSRQKGELFYVDEKSGESLEANYKFMLTVPVLGERMNEFLKSGGSFPTYQIDHVVNFSHGNLIFITYEPVPESWEIFKRFGTVFEQTYTRFLDLQKAEAQARESQIEAALEKIRSKSLAMHHSNELEDVIAVMFEKLNELNVLLGTVAIWLFNKATMDSIFWVGNSWQQPALVHLPYDEQLIKEDTNYKDSWKAWLTGESYLNREYNAEQKDKYFQYVFAHNDFIAIPPAAREMLMQGKKYTACLLVEKNSALYFDSWQEAIYDEARIQVLKRAAKVFEQAYVRFLDLQKAEAQAREAQIELGLERVRARAMAMQKSDELAEAAKLLYDEFRTLNINSVTCGYAFINELPQTQTVWVTLPDGTLLPDYIVFPLTGDLILNDRYKSWQQKEPLHKAVLEGEVNKEHHRFLASQVPANISTEIFEHIPENIVFYSANFSAGYLMIIAAESFSAENELTITRFAKVFEITYTRFLDLQRAEEQAREAQIELAMERVRARAMAMQKSDELADVAGLLFKQVSELGIKVWTTGFNVWSEDNNYYTDYITSPQGGFIEPYTIDATAFPVFKEVSDARKSGEEFFVSYLEGQILKDTYLELSKFGDEKQYEKMLEGGFQFPSRQFNHFIFGSKVSLLFITYEPVPEAHDTFKRFGKVFEQTYTRFLDLQKAEAQAREAKIEAALERVRSRSMAMHKSDELKHVMVVVFEKLKELGFVFEGSGIQLFTEGSKDIVQWVAAPDHLATPILAVLPYTEEDFMDSEIVRDIWMAKEKGENVYNKSYSFDEKNNFFKYAGRHNDFDQIPVRVREFQLQAPSYTMSLVAEKHSALWIDSYSGQTISVEELNVLKRIAKVFEQAYTRFLDLLKAEAQAREANIEAAMERLRSKAMAMQQSGAFDELIQTMYEELKKLDDSLNRCFIMIFDRQTKGVTWWMAGDDVAHTNHAYYIPYSEHPPQLAYLKGWEEQQEKWQYTMEGKEKKEWDTFLFHETDLAKLPGMVIEHMKSFEKIYLCASFNGFGCLTTGSVHPLSAESFDILIRFAKVFDFSYTRFNDLKQAEAQAREAQIEVAVERVRAKALAMHRSEEIMSVVQTLRHELGRLNIDGLFSASIHLKQDDGSVRLWDITIHDELNNAPSSSWDFTCRLEEMHPRLYIKRIWDATENYFVFEQDEHDFPILIEWVRQFKEEDADEIDRAIKEYNIKSTWFAATQLAYGRMNIELLVPPSTEIRSILSKIGAAFDLTYKRFLDLQKAEAQAREAQIELGLERVRAKAMAMQKSDEVMDVAVTVYDQLQKLDFKFGAATIIIMDEKTGNMEHWLAGFIQKNHVESYQVNNIEHPLHAAQLAGWRGGEKYVSIEMSGPALKSYAEEMLTQSGYRSLPDEEKAILLTNEHAVFNLAYMKQGALMWAPSALSDENAIVLQRFAKVFEQTYTRFLDLKKAESQARRAERDLIEIKAARKKAEDALNALKAMQTQLIQSEKMASLGELTAGIAHEIQNPLNFVNNFSGINAELLDELKAEAIAGNMEGVLALANDIRQNEEKIVHHGTRADSIVKSMLQHSGKRVVVKESTDINALADEFLRLSYHGFRAKDKLFNATIETHFDSSIDKVDLLPQDIGRVLLNLYNNAFYAVQQKQKLVLEGANGEEKQGYYPMVTVSTRRKEKQVEILVRDNGTGIPESVKSKIFQPFFTTKPAGEGTGLGLSLSYDIITKGHGGEFKLETKEGAYAEFTIQLPL